MFTAKLLWIWITGSETQIEFCDKAKMFDAKNDTEQIIGPVRLNAFIEAEETLPLVGKAIATFIPTDVNYQSVDTKKSTSTPRGQNIFGGLLKTTLYL